MRRILADILQFISASLLIKMGFKETSGNIGNMVGNNIRDFGKDPK